MPQAGSSVHAPPFSAHSSGLLYWVSPTQWPFTCTFCDSVWYSSHCVLTRRPRIVPNVLVKHNKTTVAVT